MEHLTASPSPVPFSGEDLFDPLEDAIRFRVRAVIESLAGDGTKDLEPWKCCLKQPSNEPSEWYQKTGRRRYSRFGTA